MYQIKNRIYIDFTKNQKSALCNFLRALVKKSPDLGTTSGGRGTSSQDEETQSRSTRVEMLLEKFIDDEKYYLELKQSRFEFIEPIIDEDIFINDTRLYIKECVKYYDYKKSQAPIIAANKEFEKKKRKFLQEVKMSKEPPTKKQLYYYGRLCKKYSIEKKELTSKLEARDEIERIINEHSRDIEITD